ncbi:MAG: hypothetical protein HY279_03445 [Nitrospinae bacterium]|nr:hypothetical protein [Nitrospinota bacterium]
MKSLYIKLSVVAAPDRFNQGYACVIPLNKPVPEGINRGGGKGVIYAPIKGAATK